MYESLSVEDVMRRDFVGVSEADSVSGAAELMQAEQTDGALVLRGGDAVGVVTAADMLEVLTSENDPSEALVESVMRQPVVTVDPTDDLAEAVGAIADRGVSWLAVVSRDGVVGALSVRDIVTAPTSLSPVGGVDSPDPEASIDAGSDVGLQSETYSTQGVCEICGALSRNLTGQNGQLLCEDCLAM